MKEVDERLSLCVSGSYSLSVRDLDHNQGETVKHYRIRNLDEGGFYITAKISFSSLKELVQHHMRKNHLETGIEAIKTQQDEDRRAMGKYVFQPIDPFVVAHR